MHVIVEVIYSASFRIDNLWSEWVVGVVFDYFSIFAIGQTHDAVYRIQDNAGQEALQGFHFKVVGHCHKYFYCVFFWKTFLVRAFCHEGIINVGDGYYPCEWMNLLAVYCHWIAFSVHFFMMLENAAHYTWRKSLVFFPLAGKDRVLF